MATNLVIGPLVSGLGFRSWFWACTSETIVAVPAGFWVAIHCATVEGIGGVFEAPPDNPRLSSDLKLVPVLFEKSAKALKAYPGARVYPIDEVRSIACKRVVVGHHPNVVLVEEDGTKWKYGPANAKALPAIRQALQDAYPDVEVS